MQPGQYIDEEVPLEGGIFVKVDMQVLYSAVVESPQNDYKTHSEQLSNVHYAWLNECHDSTCFLVMILKVKIEEKLFALKFEFYRIFHVEPRANVVIYLVYRNSVCRLLSTTSRWETNECTPALLDIKSRRVPT